MGNISLFFADIQLGFFINKLIYKKATQPFRLDSFYFV